MKLHQAIALLPAAKNRLQSVIDKIHKAHQAPAIFSGLSRTYQPLTDDGDKLPDESKLVTQIVEDGLESLRHVFVDAIKICRAQDEGNCAARADVKLGDVTIPQVPVTHLLYLEKRVKDLTDLVAKIPTLDPAHKWEYDEGARVWRSAPTQKIRTRKDQKVLVHFEPTAQHPGKSETITVDVAAGTWTEVQLSGAVPARAKREWQRRLQQVADALTVAREEANAAEVKQDGKAGEQLFDFIFNQPATK